jgi:hypothetical protein
MLRKTFAMLRRAFPMLRTVVHATFNEECCERVANVFQACCERGCVQHPTSKVFLPLSHVATMLRLYCDHVATRVACNIQHQGLSSPSSSTQTQHHMSATSKLNIPKIKISCLQHPTSKGPPPQHNPQHHTSAISKLNIRNIQN